MPRGGRRGGAQGVKYPNRSDLRTGPLPVSAPQGLPYGDRQKLVAAQRAVPMGPAPTPGLSAQPVPAPGPVPGANPLIAPTQRPNEPITHGLPIGPGAGPEALTGVGQAGFAQQNVANLLTSLSQQPGAGNELGNLASYASSGKG